jgi:hypothetical protein
VSRSVIGRSMVLVDRFGREWKRSEEYQETDAGAPGWLELEYDRQRLSFGQVVRVYGFQVSGEESYLKVKEIVE